MSLLIQIGAVVLIPFIWRKLFGVNQKQQNIQVVVSNIERLFSLVFVAFAVASLVALHPPQSFYTVINANPLAPGYALRNSFVSKITSTSTQDLDAELFTLTDGFQYIRPLKRKGKMASLFRDLDYAEELDTTDEESPQSPLDKLEALYELLKVNVNRDNYIRYGHQTFVKCTWCQTPAEWSMVHLTFLFPQYAVILLTCFAMIVVEALFQKGHGSRRAGVFGFILYILAGFLACEVMMAFVPKEYFDEIMSIMQEYMASLDDFTSYMRQSLMAMCFFVMAYAPFRPLSDKEKLRVLSFQQLNILSQTRMLRVHNMAICNDAGLLQKFKSHHVVAAEESKILLGHPEVQAVRQRLTKL